MPWWTAVAASALVLGTGLIGGAGCAARLHPALDIVSLQEPIDAGLRRVNPYFACLYAEAYLKDGGDAARVRPYLQWYLDNLNYPDSHGLTGTIDDMEVHHGGRMRKTGTYDSADGYAAVFLVLLESYERISGDGAFCDANRSRIEDVAWLLLLLQDPDGLLRAHPGTHAHYLMDNCEAYGGLLAIEVLSRRRGWNQGPRYREAAENVRRAVISTLGAAADQPFHWADVAGHLHPSDWERYYPDALAQVFPILYGVVDVDSPTARRLWGEFEHRHGAAVAIERDPAQRVIIDLTRKLMEP